MASLLLFVVGLLLCVSQSNAATYTESDRVSECCVWSTFKTVRSLEWQCFNLVGLDKVPIESSEVHPLCKRTYTVRCAITGIPW